MDGVSANDIRDADLREELEKIPEGSSGYQAMVRVLADSQRKRDEEEKRLAALPREKRRRALTSKDLRENPPTRDDLRHMHSVLAICGLPYTELPLEQRDFRRQQGNMIMKVTSGTLDDDEGNAHLQPIPYGPKARIVLMHLSSEAIRQKSPTINIADTLTQFVRDMGFPNSAGARGPVTAFKEQLNALSACTMKISSFSQGNISSRNITPIDAFDIWIVTTGAIVGQ